MATRYRGVLLDFYGTLVHEDDDVVSDICDKIARHATVEVSAEAIGRFWSGTFFPLCHGSWGDAFMSQRGAALAAVRRTLDHVGAPLDAERLIARQFAHWVAPPLFPDSLPFLSALASIDVSVCIVSNIDRADLEQAFAHHGLRFDHVITSDGVQAYKPRPEIFAAALAQLGMRAGEVLHIGDSRTSDVAGAIGAGIDVAWLNRTGKTASAEVAPTYTLSGLDEVLALLAGS